MPRSVMLRDLAREGRLVEIGCSACGTVSYEQPEDLLLKMNVEVSLIENFYPCPACGTSNEGNSRPVWVRPDPRK